MTSNVHAASARSLHVGSSIVRDLAVVLCGALTPDPAGWEGDCTKATIARGSGMGPVAQPVFKTGEVV